MSNRYDDRGRGYAPFSGRPRRDDDYDTEVRRAGRGYGPSEYGRGRGGGQASEGLEDRYGAEYGRGRSLGRVDLGDEWNEPERRFGRERGGYGGRERSQGGYGREQFGGRSDRDREARDYGRERDRVSRTFGRERESRTFGRERERFERESGSFGLGRDAWRRDASGASSRAVTDYEDVYSAGHGVGYGGLPRDYGRGQELASDRGGERFAGSVTENYDVYGAGHGVGYGGLRREEGRGERYSAEGRGERFAGSGRTPGRQATTGGYRTYRGEQTREYGRSTAGGYGLYGTSGQERRRDEGEYRGERGGREYEGYEGGEERGFFERAVDEVASWFGDEDAARRRRMDERRDSQSHRGRGPKGYSRSNDRIREDVSDRLADDDFVDASDVEVHVEAGVVTLTGQVADRWSKRRATDLAQQVSGVKDVLNDLRVRREATTSATPGV